MTTTLGKLGSGTFGAFAPQDLAPPKPKTTPPVDVDQELIKAAESKGELEKARAQEELTSKEMLAKGEEKTAKEYAKSIAEDPARAMLEEKIQERDRVKFVPTQENVKDLGLMFTLTNLLGFMIGGKSKGNAQAAMSAMNGMLEGHQKGLADQYKKEKDIYDENVKALDKTIDSLYKKIQDGVQLYATNRDAGLAEIRTAIAEHNANFLKDSLEKYGPAYAFDKIKTIKEMKDKKDLADERLRQSAERLAHEKVIEQQGQQRLAMEQQRLGMEQQRIGLQSSKLQTDTVNAVKQFTGANLLPKEAKEVTDIASAAGESESLKNYVDQHRDVIGRSGQINRTIERYVDSFRKGIEPPDSSQPDLVFAKRYAAYLVKYERSIAGGAKGFTVQFQKRFNDLLQQDQFSTEGFKNLMNEQETEYAKAANTFSPTHITKDNLMSFGKFMNSQTEGDSATSAAPTQKPTPTQADIDWVRAHPEDRAKFVQHFGVEP